MSTKLNLLALSLSLYSHSVFAGSDWWWNTSLPKNTNSTLTIKAGTTGNATKNISINSTAANLTRYSSVGSQPYAIVQTNVGSLAKTRVIFTNTALAINWTVPTGITSIKLFLMGGGGGGCASYVNGVDTYGGGGGGAGEIVESNMTVTPGTVCSGFLGSGGSGGTGSVGMAGSIGGATQFVCGASTKRAYGGQGCNGLANMTMGSAYGGGGQPPGGITTAMPADGTYPINSTGQYYDSDIHGVVAAYAKYSPSTATHAIQVADSSLRNIPAGGGGGYYGSSPGNFKGESDGSNNDLAPGANSRIYGKGGMGYFGKGGDGG